MRKTTGPGQDQDHGSPYGGAGTTGATAVVLAGVVTAAMDLAGLEVVNGAWPGCAPDSRTDRGFFLKKERAAELKISCFGKSIKLLKISCRKQPLKEVHQILM